MIKSCKNTSSVHKRKSNLKENYRNKKTNSSDIFPEETAHLKLSRAIRCPTYDLENDFVVFDLKGLSSFPDLQAVMILIITDFILGRVEANDPEIASKKKRILMDECWELLKGKSSSHFMEYCVRTLRKTGSGITFITQGIEEIAQHPIGSAILGNTATKFILMQRGDLKPLKDILKLNEKELELIASLRSQKREFSEAFMVSHEDRAVIRVYPSQKEYWVATSDAGNKIRDLA